MKNMSNRLRLLRLEKRISQGNMAKKLQISQSGYSKYENGTAEPNIDTLCKLATMFNISVDELIGHTELKDKSNIVNLDYLDNTRKNLIKEILNASDVAVGRLDAFYQGIKLAEIEREEIVKKLKGNKNDN